MHSNTVAVVLGLVALASFSSAGLAGDYGGLGGQQYDIPQQYDGADNAIYGGEYDNYHGPAQYSFEYGVNDPFTGDEKRQQETREGDQVTGHYSVKEADGTTRHVHYTADDYTGFKATVTKSGQPAYQPGQYGYQKETLSNY